MKLWINPKAEEFFLNKIHSEDEDEGWSPENICCPTHYMRTLAAGRPKLTLLKRTHNDQNMKLPVQE